MSEPPLEPLRGPAFDLLDRERQRPGAPDGAKRNVQVRLQLTLAGIGAGGAKGLSATGSALGSAASHALAFVAGGIAGIAIYAHIASKPVPVAAARPLTAEPSAPSELATVEVVSALDSAPSPPPTPAVSRDAISSQSDLKAERALLDKARAALGRGDDDVCLAIVKTHADTFPRGHLAEEREGLAIKALVNLGRAAEARQRGARFRAHYPRSLLLPAVESALGSIP
jgi:hypothetical protein